MDEPLYGGKYLSRSQSKSYRINNDSTRTTTIRYLKSLAYILNENGMSLLEAFQEAIRQNESISIKYSLDQDIFEIHLSDTDSIVAVVYLSRTMPAPQTTDDHFERCKTIGIAHLGDHSEIPRAIHTDFLW